MTATAAVTIITFNQQHTNTDEVSCTAWERISRFHINAIEYKCMRFDIRAIAALRIECWKKGESIRNEWIFMKNKFQRNTHTQSSQYDGNEERLYKTILL